MEIVGFVGSNPKSLRILILFRIWFYFFYFDMVWVCVYPIKKLVMLGFGYEKKTNVVKRQDMRISRGKRGSEAGKG